MGQTARSVHTDRGSHTETATRRRPDLRLIKQGAERQPDRQLPERPKLAPDVELAGQLRESAYEDPPWLLERRDSGYVQVTELLYHIAERCDGKHTCAEIAREVSGETGREVSEDNVRQLVTEQLLAKGLVADAQGRVVKPPAAARSLLAIRMRLKMLGPEVIGPITRVLRVLYWPPILLVALGVGAAAQWWLYAVHGVGAGFHQAIYTPALLLPLMVLLVLAAALHEFGHASALRYGGGEAKAMGAGFYLVYPVLYTDVSDNYRLPRWARIRTDLGGFYFNLLFSLGVMLAYALTGIEFLLVVVVLINLDILKQLLPFVRLDGYWALVDLTGMPDFFSQIGGFVRGLVPGRRVKKGEAPPPKLKWWARIVFLLYIVVTVPFLALSGLLMTRSVPRVLVTAWHSAGKIVAFMGRAHAAGEVLAVAAGIGQLVLLALPTVGLLYAVYSFGRRIYRFIAKWSKDSPIKRAIGAAGAAALAIAVGLMWAPQVPLFNAPGPLYSRRSFEPIGENERMLLRDAVRGDMVARDGTRLEPAATQRATQAAGTQTPARGTVTPAVPTAQATVAGAVPGVVAVRTPTAVPRATATAVRPAPSAARASTPVR